MRAAHVAELGQTPHVVDVPEPADATLTVEAVGLNPLDINIAAGRFYGGHPPLPYVPGCEAAARTHDGSLVYLFGDGRGIAGDGFMAERVSFGHLLPVPEGSDPYVVAALGIAGIAAWVSVAWKAEVGPDDRVLVLGASGTVGRLAMQAAHLLGAAEVVGASRHPRDDLVSYDDVPDEFTVCIDPVWGEPLARVLAKAAPHARVIHVGQSAGPESPLRSADVRGKELQILGHSNFALTPEERDRAYLELLEHVTAGRIALDIETYALDDVAPAWERQQAGAKVVIRV